MLISHIETFAASIPVREEMAITGSRGAHRVSPFLIVKVETESGLVGVGEATTMPRWSGETCWTAKTMIEEVFRPVLVGVDSCDLEAVDAAMDAEATNNWFAKAAIEMACWDIRGKVERKPIYELLGGPHRPLTIPARFSMSAYPPDLAAAKAVERVHWGFTTIKIKVGTVPEVDVARVRAVREAVGPDISVMIDANCGWDAPTAIRCCRELEDCNLSLVEQPTTNGDFGAMAEVRKAIDVPIMADDICFDYSDAVELIRNECCDVISVYPGKQGGIRKAAKIVKFAEDHGVACSIGSNLEWDVSTAAMGHLVVGMKNMLVEQFPGDILGPWYHVDRIVTEPLKIERATCTLTDKPGLGVEIDWDKLNSYKIVPQY
ncbi:MAG TPA: enolase C-terminal domain-like protein [Planctomycetaceae bacterium]|nr:enolase C-terminal domain-like protein [Planctomycetaceae bacterium]